MTATHTFRPTRKTSPSTTDRVLKRLGRFLEMDISKRGDIVRITREGLPVNSAETFFERTHLNRSATSFVIPPRTLAHRRSANKPLNTEETGRLIRLGKILALAEEVFGDEEIAKGWINKPRNSFDGLSAMELLKTEEGAQVVEESLWKIDSGFFA